MLIFAIPHGCFALLSFRKVCHVSWMKKKKDRLIPQRSQKTKTQSRGIKPQKRAGINVCRNKQQVKLSCVEARICSTLGIPAFMSLKSNSKEVRQLWSLFLQRSQDFGWVSSTKGQNVSGIEEEAVWKTARCPCQYVLVVQNHARFILGTVNSSLSVFCILPCWLVFWAPLFFETFQLWSLLPHFPRVVPSGSARQYGFQPRRSALHCVYCVTVRSVFPAGTDDVANMI